MLERLLISDFAVIEEIEVSFANGLTALTGETGAGKSIIVDALHLLLGAKANPEMIRSGSERAVVQGVFRVQNNNDVQRQLRELGLAADADEDELLIVRELQGSRSYCRVNGRLVNVGTLRDLGIYLVDMHGQHEHQSLLRRSAHLGLVDKYAGTEAEALLADLRQTLSAYRSAERELAELKGDARERARLIDLLEFQIGEIEAAGLVPEEDIKLRQEREQLLHFEKTEAALSRSYDVLYAGLPRDRSVLDRLGAVLQELKDAERYCPELGPHRETLQQSSYLIEDASRELASLRDSLSFEPYRLQEIEERLDAISRLRLKYGDSVEQILLFRDEAAASLSRIHESATRVEVLATELARLRGVYDSQALDLSVLRQNAAAELSRRAESVLQELGLQGARFSAAVSPRDAAGLYADGRDEVEFLFSANLGEELRSLSRIASGGEISRVMLALKTVLSGVDEIPTLVFDEIDSGVGGRTAYAVAEKITQVAGTRQVLCITHLPQIAAAAKNHLFVSKHEAGGRTYTGVHSLRGEEREREIARMLSGSVSSVALSHARELLGRVQPDQ